MSISSTPSPEIPPRYARGLTVSPKTNPENAMIDYNARYRSGNIMLAAIAFLISLPLLIGAIHDAIDPASVTVNDKYLETYDEFELDIFEKIALEKIRISGLGDDKVRREKYNKIADAHWERVADQTRRNLLMYSGLALVSFGYLVFTWRDARIRARNEKLYSQNLSDN